MNRALKGLIKGLKSIEYPDVGRELGLAVVAAVGAYYFDKWLRSRENKNG